VTREENNREVYNHNLLGEKGKFSFTVNEMESSNYKICIMNPRGYDTSYLKEVNIKLVVNSDNMDDPDLSQSIATADVNPVKDKLSKAISKVSVIFIV